MENYLQFLENAKKYADTAEHLLTETYPVVKEPRMLLSVLQNIFSAYKSVVMFFIYRDVALKKIPPFLSEDFKEMFDYFKARSERRYSINPEYIKAIEEINATLKEHKSSPMEFSRHEMLVICSDNYRLKTITTQNLREYINKAKLFIDETSNTSAKHG